MLVMAFGCAPQVIYVTPTPGPTLTTDLAAMASATAAAQAALAPTLSETPTSTVTETSTVEPSTATSIAPTVSETPFAAATATVEAPSATAAIPEVTPGPTSIVQGPIVGPEYALPASPVPPSPQPVSPTAGPSPTSPPEGVTPSPVNLPTLNGSEMGIQLDVNLDDSDWDFAMSKIEQLGVSWIKVQLPWRDMQPTGPTENDNPFFRRVEQHIEDANRRGFNVLVSVVKAPLWARSSRAEDGPPDDPQALANFITFLFAEINAGDRPQDQAVYGLYIDAVEVWNEPNLIREWQGNLAFTGAGYMRLFDAAYDAVRAVSPDVPVITAGLAPVGEVSGARNDRAFLREMYAAGLAGSNYQNVYVGVHPYGWGNAPDATCCDSVDGRSYDNNRVFYFRDTLDDYRDIMVNSGDSNRRMWVTEFGWATWDGFPGAAPEEWMSYQDKWGQGGYTIRAFQIGQERDYIGPMVLWNLNFSVLSGLIENRDERAAYSILVPGESCQVDVSSRERTERPLFWMLFDAIHTDVPPLSDFCGVPPLPLPGLPGT
jgi:hypothetical protein